MRNGHGKIRTAENRRPFHTLKVSGTAALLSNESLLLCLCCVRMYVHLYIGEMCDVNASFWHFLVYCVFVQVRSCHNLFLYSSVPLLASTQKAHELLFCCQSQRGNVMQFPHKGKQFTWRLNMAYIYNVRSCAPCFLNSPAELRAFFFFFSCKMRLSTSMEA